METKNNVSTASVAAAGFPGITWLFTNKYMAWVWLPVRLYVGWQWLHAGWGKVTNPAWVGSEAGKSITGFLNGALAKATGDHPAVSSWYAWLISHVALPNAEVFSYLIAFGELLVGVALILGLLTGVAAFFGAVMNMNFMLAGSLSSNPVLLVLQFFLMLAWRIAGWVGLDRFVLKFIRRG